MGTIQKEMVPVRTSYIFPVPPYTDGWCSRRNVPFQFARRDKPTIQITSNLANYVMKHLTTIADIEQTLEDNRLCLFFIKTPDCGVCNVMLDKVGKLAESFSSLCSYYTDISEEPLIAGRFLVYSGPTVLLMMEGKEVYRGVQFINLEELKQTISRYLALSKEE